MARLRGVEPPTSGSGDQRSIQLSYRRVASSKYRTWTLIITAATAKAPPFYTGLGIRSRLF